MFVQALKEALAHIRVCSRLEGLLLKKKFLNNGDTPEVHAQKVCFSLAVGPLLITFLKHRSYCAFVVFYGYSPSF